MSQHPGWDRTWGTAGGSTWHVTRISEGSEELARGISRWPPGLGKGPRSWHPHLQVAQGLATGRQRSVDEERPHCSVPGVPRSENGLPSWGRSIWSRSFGSSQWRMVSGPRVSSHSWGGIASRPPGRQNWDVGVQRHRAHAYPHTHSRASHACTYLTHTSSPAFVN